MQLVFLYTYCGMMHGAYNVKMSQNLSPITAIRTRSTDKCSTQVILATPCFGRLAIHIPTVYRIYNLETSPVVGSNLSKQELVYEAECLKQHQEIFSVLKLTVVVSVHTHTQIDHSKGFAVSLFASQNKHSSSKNRKNVIK